MITLPAMRDRLLYRASIPTSGWSIICRAAPNRAAHTPKRAVESLDMEDGPSRGALCPAPIPRGPTTPAPLPARTRAAFACAFQHLQQAWSSLAVVHDDMLAHYANDPTSAALNQLYHAQLECAIKGLTGQLTPAQEASLLHPDYFPALMALACVSPALHLALSRQPQDPAFVESLLRVMAGGSVPHGQPGAGASQPEGTGDTAGSSCKTAGA